MNIDDFYKYSESHEQKLLDTALSDVLSFVNAYWRFKNLPIAQDTLSSTDKEHIALYSIIARQIGGLDAASEVAKVGRPEFVSVINRTLFELWLALLAIAYYNDGKITQKILAERFLGHASFHFAQEGRYILPHLIVEARGKGKNSVLLEAECLKKIHLWENSARQVGITNSKQPWHPFGGNFAGVKNLFKAIWPEDGAPIFPEKIVQHNYEQWQALYFLAWEWPSHRVHAGGSGIGHLIRRNADSMIDDQRRIEASCLKTSLDLVEKSMNVFTDRLGLYDEWQTLKNIKR